MSQAVSLYLLTGASVRNCPSSQETQVLEPKSRTVVGRQAGQYQTREEEKPGARGQPVGWKLEDHINGDTHAQKGE